MRRAPWWVRFILRSSQRDEFMFPPETKAADDDLLPTLVHLAEVRRESGMPTATAAAHEAIESNPCSARLRFCAAVGHRLAGEREAAKADLAVALALCPGDPLAYKHLALMLEEEGEKAAAAVVRRQSGEAMWRLWPRQVRPSDESEALLKDITGGAGGSEV